MPLERMTAIKVRIKDITSGQWIKNEGMVPSYVITPYGEQVSRSRIIGTVVSKYVTEDGNFASVTIDDSSDTVRLKTFKTVKPLDVVEIGDIVDVVGKVKEYNGEIYIIPESVRKKDISWEMLRKLEVVSKIDRFGIKTHKEDMKQDTNIKAEVLKIIGSSKDGIKFIDVVKQANARDTEVEDAINDLLSEGICYEARPGIIRKI